MVFVTLATIRPKAENAAEPTVTSRKHRPQIPPRLHVQEPLGHQNFDRSGGNDQDVIRQNAGREHGAGAQRREAEAAENPCFTESHELDAESPEASHHGHGKN